MKDSPNAPLHTHTDDLLHSSTRPNAVPPNPYPGMSAQQPHPAGHGAPVDSGARIIGTQNNSKGPGPTLMLADTLSGNDVINFADEHIGSLKGIMLDVQGGRIAYAVLSVGGFLGIGDKLFAIPWGALILDTNNECFKLDADKEKLSKAEGFDKDNWPSMAEPQWAENLHHFYNTRPYWE